MITFLLSKLKLEKKSLLLPRVKMVKMNYGYSLLKKLGLNYVEVMNHLKWEEQVSSFRILMQLRQGYYGLMIMKLIEVRRNC
jgi:hypothetical protein